LEREKLCTWKRKVKGGQIISYNHFDGYRVREGIGRDRFLQYKIVGGGNHEWLGEKRK